MSPPGRPAPDLVEPVIGSPVGTTPVLLAPVVLPQHAPDTPPAPPPRTPGVAWGTPVAAQAPAKRSKPNHLLHWNWAAGSVVGLAVLILVFAVPRFAVAADLHQVSDQQTGDWLLYGAGLGSILTIICLASRRIAVVALLSLATSVAAIVAIVQLQGTWTLSDHNTWASLGLVVGLAILGITSSIGLRRAG